MDVVIEQRVVIRLSGHIFMQWHQLHIFFDRRTISLIGSFLAEYFDFFVCGMVPVFASQWWYLPQH